MKKFKYKNLILRAVMMLLVISFAFGGALCKASASTLETSASELSYVEGDFFLNYADAIKDPKKVTTSAGYYYDPSAYIYFGEKYNSATKMYEPILCRVLDADADSTGASGAMFVIMEKAYYDELRFGLQSESINDYVAWENAYQKSYPHFYTQNVTNAFTNMYNTSIRSSMLDELSFIRYVTKTDSAESMAGAFGYDAPMYSWEVETGADLENASELSDKLVDNQRFFLLSVDEVLNYIGNYNGAPGLKTVHGTTKSPVSWWLRTGVSDIYGNLVGYVDENGNVGQKSADEKAYLRYAFNIETSGISYVQHLGNNIYKLAFIYDAYKDTQAPFKASVTDVKDGVVTVKYSNAILANKSYGGDEQEYISVIIKDKDTGAVKYYGIIGEVPEGDEFNEISAEEYYASFTLPENYENGDTVSVFWEKKQENSESISYTSNMAELECIHVEGAAATCDSYAICSVCNEEYGSYDSENHANKGREYYFDAEKDIHYNKCLDCGAHVNEENCVFGYTCVSYCVCGNIEIQYDMHYFDENGICVYNKTHFEDPVRIDKGIISDFEIYNEGQLISLGQYINSGDTSKWGYPSVISIKSDLDFTNISGFVPIGTAEHPFDALSVLGEQHTIKGLNVVSDGANVGLFGVAKDVSISYLTLEDSSFSGVSNVGALIGTASGVDIKYVLVDGVKLYSSDGVVGSLAAISDDSTEINVCISYDITDKDGKYIPFTYDKNASVSQNSFCLADEAGENGERSLAQFESGELGYIYSSLNNLYGKRGGQKIGVDKYPYFGGEMVYMTETCDKEIRYFNDESLKATIEAHTYTSFADEEVEWVWEPKMGTETYNCSVKAVCGKCGHIGMAYADVFMDYSRVPVRADYTATITMDGVTKTDTKTVIGIHIEDMIGMTYIEKDFDGIGIPPEDMMDNHRLVTSPPKLKEFEVYFIDSVTKEKLWEQTWDGGFALAATKAGSYDLVVVGKNDYEGQTYIYEGAVVIRPITVTLNAYAEEKFYDGSTHFEVGYDISNENISNEWFKLSLSDVSSAQIGEYELKVSISYITSYYDYEIYKDSVTLVLENEIIKAAILPPFYQEIENINYPTEFTYGDTIPIPSVDNFKVGDESELTFEWYKVVYSDVYGFEYEGSEKIDFPKDAGDYILRVIASPTDMLLGTYEEFQITVKKKTLSIEFVAPQGVTTELHDSETWYIIDDGEKIDIKVNGLADGDTLESAGIYTDISYYGNGLNENGFPNQPGKDKYVVYYYARCRDELGRYGNYEEIYDVIYVYVRTPINPIPITDSYIYDGNAKSFDVIFSWNELDIPEDHIRYYYITVTDENGNTVKTDTITAYDDSVDGRILYTQAITSSGKYYVTVESQLYDKDSRAYTERTVTEEIEFEVSINDGSLSEIIDLGKYTVSVTSGTETASADVYIKRQIQMLVKECSFNISDQEMEFDIRNIVMEAGGVFLLGHTLTDVEFFVNAESGKITVASFKVVDKQGNDVTYLYELNTTVYAWSHSNGGYNVVHIYTNSCDSKCNIWGCDAERAASHSGGYATCSTLAICKDCGASYGDYSETFHELDRIIYLPNYKDLTTHRAVYACCGSEIGIASHTASFAATCTSRSICSECSWEFGELDFNNHSSKDCTYAPDPNDQTKHIATHACCSKQESISHSGGAATCKELAKCEHCGASYGELDPHNHAEAAVAAPDDKDPTMHTRTHACCGASYYEAHSGGTANCILKAVCQYCSASYGELAPSNHANTELVYVTNDKNTSMHDVYHSCCNTFIQKEYHSGGVANCASEALCKYCGEAYGIKDTSVHASTEYSYIQNPSDPAQHMKYYACCGVEIGAEAHFGGAQSCKSGTICEGCGVQYREKIEHTYDNACDAICNACGELTRSLVFHIDENNDHSCDSCGAAVESEPLSGGAISAICVSSVAVAGAGGFSLFWFVFKKRSLAELLKLLLG